ncbi:MAG: hypothetical protein NDF54_11635, partial [archaeon GB-1867-035]|nr:hypothetical protein [Candidatus Culexmicrobium profundum]
MKAIESRLEILEEAASFREKYESGLEPLTELNPRNLFIYMAIGGGELGDLALTAAKRILGGVNGGVKTVAIDRYHGFPAQDAADAYEIIDMLNGDLLEKAIRKYISDP